jgi:2',3'-cyclic-nucleotide 2'-phosphodiesterase (5'-nucleotidase family)
LCIEEDVLNFEIPTQSFLLTIHKIFCVNFSASQADLAKVDRKKTPWLIVLLHAPWYNSNWAHQGEGDSMMAAMEPLLYAAHVDMVIAGHVHAYERAV